MKRNIKGLVLVLLFGVQGLLSGNALSYDASHGVSLQAQSIEGTAFPRSAEG